jgi:hypothetical protein
VLELGVSSARFIPADDALDRLKVTTSPAWIIRVDGEDHIFEGSYDLVKLFDKEGNFLLSGEGEAVPKKQTTSSDGPGLLTQHSVPLKRHSVKNGIPFNIPYNIPFRIPGRSFIMEDTAPPRRLSPNDTTAVNEALPACRESVVRRNPVGSASPMTLVLDALFYDAENKQHGERTKRVTTNPVPYKNGQRINEADPNESPWQLFAPLFGVRCLPTRFHFIKEKGVGYMEYREGEEAFTETKSEFDLTL